MAEAMSPRDKIALINKNLQEVLNPEIIEDVIVKQNRPLAVYWGKPGFCTATTGRPHCGYFVPMLKLAHFLQAGCKVKILLADIHGFLDNLKAPIELVKFRAEYYKYVITALLKAVNVPIDKLEFVLGSSYQLSEKYTMDIFRLSSVVTEHDAKKAGAEVVKQVENATLSGLIYPLMQALDEEHLGVDAQFGGVDQRKIFALAKEVLPRVGYKERAHLMNPMVPGLAGEVVKKKIKKAFAPPKEVEGNGMMSFVEYVLLPAGALQGEGQKFVVERREGEPLVYTNIEKMHEDYKADILTPQLLKSGVTAALLALLEPVQAAFQASQEWQDIERKAYPPPPEKKKKEKKKDLGKFHPDAKKVEARPDGSVQGHGQQQVSVSTGAEEAMKQLELEKKAVES
ncbi:hypothetical protein B0A49_08704 [Cryomyces minteri]|uniref:Tyrosine--tRNA ligase n=1 Tax=Cryomyces minteri TaxID=331657 RepID=A0A4V5NG32_9PEZI|nr:hypothetical protein B0A49_08704 [Cryomyces minteri]